MSALEWIQLLLLGGLAGSIGQIVRGVVGVKHGQHAATIGASTSDLNDVSRFAQHVGSDRTRGFHSHRVSLRRLAQRDGVLGSADWYAMIGARFVWSGAT